MKRSRLYFYGTLVFLLLVVSVFIKNPVIGSDSDIKFKGQANPSKMRDYVEALSDSDEFRNIDNMERLDEVAQYIFNTLEKMGLKPQWQVYKDDNHTYRNITLKFEGGGDGKLVVLGAHYDVCYETPGADDNASGVAGLLELARLIQLNSDKLKRPVELVFYTLEEPPYFRTQLMGSAVHAESLSQAGDEIDLMISIEMIGRFSEEKGSQTYPMLGLSLLYPSEGNFIALVGRPKDWWIARKVKSLLVAEEGVEIQSINAPTSLPGIDFSDHLNYWNRGMPALMVSDTAFLRNFDYHKLTDTSDKLDYQKMAKFVDQLLRVPFEY